MNKLFLILMFFVPSMLFAQKTKKFTNEDTNEIFYALNSDKKNRHGEYNKFNFYGKLLVKGYYKSGIKDSIWECFDHIKTSIGKEMDKEIVRVLQLIPDFWLPGLIDGEPVDVEVEFPFIFKNLGEVFNFTL